MDDWTNTSNTVSWSLGSARPSSSIRFEIKPENFFFSSSDVLVPSSRSWIGILSAIDGSWYTLLFSTRNSPFLGTSTSCFSPFVIRKAYLYHILDNVLVVEPLLEVLELVDLLHEPLGLPGLVSPSLLPALLLWPSLLSFSLCQNYFVLKYNRSGIKR
jgi:hypothetical protein